MIDIHAHKKELTTITTMIKSLLDVDAAVFDLDSRLLAATDEYIRQKGRSVHAPSIREVLANGSVVVNRPGHMAACDGCRFIGNCPAKIEILTRFGTPAGPLGVMTLTSFSRRGHERITRDTKTYIDALTLFSEWTAGLVHDRDRARIFSESQDIIHTLMELSGDAVLTVDTQGMVTRGNARALDLFASCDICTRSVSQIFPGPVADKILDGSHIKAANIKIGNRDTFLSARPVHTGSDVSGAVLTLSRPPEDQPCPRPGPSASPGKCQEQRSTGFDAVLGNTPAMVRVKKTADRLSGSASTMLITGDTGTGKGMLARAIHDNGNRQHRPFVPVNCAAIPDTLFESELFGYEEGAFTGAKKGGKPGRFELAHQGTLFLDEIGEMPLRLQAKLLNALEDHSFQRVGGLEFIRVNVRIIAATNKDLEALVREKKFRADLFYRLNVIPLELPPLSLRKKDLPLLCSAFISAANLKAGTVVTEVSDDVMDLFYTHHWPGNIRELQNLVEYGVNMAPGNTITRQDLPQRFLDGATPPRIPAGSRENGDPPPEGIRQKTARAQAKAIRECLARYGNDVNGKKKAAQELGISIRTLYRKLAESG